MNKRKQLSNNVRKNIPLILMSAPAVILLIMFKSVPMFGTVLAFKNYTYRDGIWGSAWAGLTNFKYIFSSKEILVTLRNTVCYHLVFDTLILLCGIMLGIMLYFIKSKRAARVYQQLIQIPYLTSFAIMGSIVYIFLRADGGVMNTWLDSMGMEAISWYTTPKYWPFILCLVNTWFGAGIKSIYFYSALLGIDQSLFEAADLDGAKWYHKVFDIMLPSIAPTICIMLIMQMGNMLASTFALFYSVTMDSSALYSVTDVISTYEYRGLQLGNIGTTAALGLFTSVVNVIGTLSVNKIVKKINPDYAMM